MDVPADGLGADVDKAYGYTCTGDVKKEFGDWNLDSESWILGMRVSARRGQAIGFDKVHSPCGESRGVDGGRGIWASVGLSSERRGEKITVGSEEADAGQIVGGRVDVLHRCKRR